MYSLLSYSYTKSNYFLKVIYTSVTSLHKIVQTECAVIRPNRRMLYARKSNFSVLLLLVGYCADQHIVALPHWITVYWRQRSTAQTNTRAQQVSSMHIGYSAKMHECRGKRDSLRYDVSSCSYGGSSSFRWQLLFAPGCHEPPISLSK